MPPAFDVVYVNYRCAALLAQSVASLRTAADADGVHARIFVVDNASGPADAQALQQIGRDAELIRFDENRGFAAACNAGAARGGSSHLLFLNPDTLVHAGALAGLSAELERHHGRAIIGPRHYLDAACEWSIGPLRGQSLCGEIADLLDDRGWLGARSLRLLHRRMQSFASTHAIRVRAVSGAALAIGREAYAQLGGFDAGYFLYAEDVDLCLRARAARLPVLYAPWLGITHFAEQSAREAAGLVAAARRDSAARFLRRHYGSAARALRAAALRFAVGLPRLHRRTDAAPVDPRAPIPRPEPRSARAVLELARSPLFDNGATCEFRDHALRLPEDLLERLAPGTFFLRTAIATPSGSWREQRLLTFAVPSRTGPRNGAQPACDGGDRPEVQASSPPANARRTSDPYPGGQQG